jgi:hypothetical protein
MIAQASRIQTAVGENALDIQKDLRLCEVCYGLIVDYGVQNVLACLARVTRLRAWDYQDSNRGECLRHHRASSKITRAYAEIAEDIREIDQILAEEQPSSARQNSLPAQRGV